MPIENIPAIAEDYPLFSWDDHAESFAALKQGAEVAGFKKETWNAIVDTLKAVLEASGQDWSSAYTSADAAKIPKAYGALYATMFNSVRHNIDHPAPIGWRWENDPTFRGYVGRKDFRGYSVYGKECDLFYAEYLIEIVRKLNLLIEILRGTAPFAEFAHSYLVETPYHGGLVAIPTAPLVADETAQAKHNADIVVVPTAPLVADETAQAKHNADIVVVPTVPLVADETAQTKHNADIGAIPVVKMESENENIGTSSSAYIIAIPVVKMESERQIVSSKSSATVSSLRIQSFEKFSEILKTAHYAEACALPLVQMNAKEALSRLFESAEMDQVESLPIGSSTISAKAINKATVEAVPALALTATETAHTKQSATIGKIPTKRMNGAVEIASITAATLDSAWLPPIRTGNNLHIRQVYDMERNGNDLRLI